MVNITRVYRQAQPAARFIGKRYGDGDRVEGGFGAKWGEWFEQAIPSLILAQYDEGEFRYEDAGAFVGLMRWKDGDPFEYWIGMFAPAGTSVPEGLGFVDFDATNLGVCWLKGPEPELYMNEERSAGRLEAEGYKIVPDRTGAWWFFERYAEGRFTDPDANGDVVLDICHFVE